MDYKNMLFKVLREHPKEVTKLEIASSKPALLELLPHSPACYLHLSKALRADKEILVAALSDVYAPEEEKRETEQERALRQFVGALFRKKLRGGDWYDYHAYTNQWRIKVPASLRRDVEFLTAALEVNSFTTNLIEHEFSQEPKFLVRIAELHGIGVFALNLDGELLRRATAGNKPGDLNIEDSVALCIYEELKANLELKQFNEQLPEGKPSTRSNGKL